MIRHANSKDVDILAKIELASYPKEEAASKNSIRERIKYFGDYFWILEENGEILAFINGMVSGEKNLNDEMYEDASLHNPDAKNFMIFSVVTNPNHRKKGYSKIILDKMIEDLEQQNKKEIVLTCKEHLLDFYARFGFVNEGISTSNHGGVSWYQMRKILN